MVCPRPKKGRGQRDENAGAKGEISKKQSLAREYTNHPLMGSKVGSKVGILWFALARRRRLRIQNSKMNHFFGIHLRSLSSYVGTTAVDYSTTDL